jgi:hypothetical protein
MTKDEALKQVLVAPVQEPETCSNCANSVWPYGSCDVCTVQFDDPTISNWEPITTPPAAPVQPEQEPVAWRYKTATFWNRDIHWRYLETLDGTEGLQSLKPLYTTQPAAQRTWVNLTDEQFLEAARLAEAGNYLVAFQRIQQWIKEGNT